MRAIFFSDSHLGFRFARAQELLDFLKQYQPDKLYVVGDFLDAWRLQQRWYWPPTYRELIDHMLMWREHGVEIFYTPGNHDAFLRKPIPQFQGIQIQDHFVHEAMDGRKYCITHGDLFDSVEQKMHRLSRAGSRVYDGLTTVNAGTNRLLRSIRIPEWNYCFWLKRASKKIVGAVNDFQQRLADFAQSQQCDGVICGHIHSPAVVLDGHFVYCNTGDWVEHRSALIEHLDGTLSLLDNGQVLKTVAPRSDRPLPAAGPHPATAAS